MKRALSNVKGERGCKLKQNVWLVFHKQRLWSGYKRIQGMISMEQVLVTVEIKVYLMKVVLDFCKNGLCTSKSDTVLSLRSYF